MRSLRPVASGIRDCPRRKKFHQDELTGYSSVRGACLQIIGILPQEISVACSAVRKLP